MQKRETNSFKAFIKENYHFISLFALFCLLTALLWNVQIHADDHVYRQAAICSYPQIIEFLKFHMREFNGRTLVHIFVILFLKYKSGFYIWCFLCAFALVFICYALGKLSSKNINHQKINTVLCCLIYISIHPVIWKSSIYWLTGSFNYLFPLALILLLILRYTKKKKADVPSIILSLICGSLHEQISMTIVGFWVLLGINDLIRRKKFPFDKILLFISTLIGYSTILLTQGTQTRAQHFSLFKNNNLIRNAANLLKLNWFENTGIFILNILVIFSAVFWLLHLKSKKKSVTFLQRFAAITIAILGVGNTAFNVFNYLFGYSLDVENPINQIIFFLWITYVVLLLGSLIYIACILYLRQISDAFIISLILGFGTQLMLILIYDIGFRTMMPALFALIMMIIVTASGVMEAFPKKKRSVAKKIVPVLLSVCMVLFSPVNYVVSKESIKAVNTSPLVAAIPESLLDENNQLKPLTDEELEYFFDLFTEALNRTQHQAKQQKDIRDFSNIPSVTTYTYR